MSDDGRLELDDDGAVVGSDTRVLDLADPASAIAAAPSPSRAWWDASAAPWLRTHRTAVRVIAGAAIVLALGGAWWSGRPPVVPPVVSLDVSNAVLDGNDLGGPEIGPDGVLSVAYAVRALTPGDRVDLRGLVGPGLVPQSVDAAPITDAEAGRVVMRSQIECTDPALAAARPASYALDVRRTDAGGSTVDAVVSLGTTTSLDLAVLGHCLEQVAPTALQVETMTLDAAAGVPSAALVLGVRNVSGLPLTVSVGSRDSDDVELDASPALAVPPAGVVRIPTRLLVHDCTSAPGLPLLATLPNPSSDDAGASGVTMRITLGTVDRLASYPLPAPAAGTVATDLATTTCGGRPTLGTRVLGATAGRSADGGWSVVATYAVRTSGVGLTVGREHFVSSGDAGGSTLATVVESGPGSLWATVPTRLDGGAGTLEVVFIGASCADLPTAEAPTMAVRVTTAERRVYPFEVRVDDGRLLMAAFDACGYAAGAALPAGWVLPQGV